MYTDANIWDMEHQYNIWLSAIEGVGAKKYQSLCLYYGNARDVFQNADHSSLRMVGGIDRGTAEKILAARTDGSLDKNMEKLHKGDITTYIVGNDNYPEILMQLYDPPPVLYTKGCMDLSDLDRSIGIVGTRRCTRYGRNVAETLAAELAGEAVTIISGMARGIDTHAHLGAMQAGGFTIAVLGCGVDIVYPPENKRMYADIMSCGVILSEFFPGTQPLPANFPARNRIISALSRGVLIVESGEKGGALITADFALEQGKDVFAVPGNIDSRASSGCNKLIKEGAIPVTCGMDILSEYGWDALFNPKQAKEEGVELSFDESRIFELLTEGDLHYDILAIETKMDNSTLAACLTFMELRGIIKQLPGRVYTLERKIASNIASNTE